MKTPNFKNFRQIKKQIQLWQQTSFKIGGPAKYFCLAKTEAQLIQLVKVAKALNIPFFIIGEGTNLLCADQGFPGLIIKCGLKKLTIQERGIVKVGAGFNLFELIKKLNKLGLGGLETLAGIPGSVGGAIYGNAGAYGHEIGQVVKMVRIFNGRGIYEIKKRSCHFGYRQSVFKQKPWIILSVTLQLQQASPAKLQGKSQEIIKIRNKKYPPTLKCAGSFFKNLLAKDLPPEVLAKIPKDKIINGKVPAGYLLEQVGAKGLRQGRVGIASWHGNLLVNYGGGKASDVLRLARILKSRVYRRFKVKLEEEVQYLPPRFKI